MQAQAAPAPPQAPPPALPRSEQTTALVPPAGSSPRAVYQALREKREVLGDQMSRMLNRRSRVTEQLHRPNVTPAERSALEQHLAELNARVIDMEKQLHAADAEVAAAAGVPGASAPPPRMQRAGPPDDMYIVGTIFGGVAAVIVAFAYARRLWKGTTNVVAQFPAALEARFARFEQALDAMAIEIERVSEGQRFLTRVLSEQKSRALDGGPAQPIESRAAMAEPVPRP